MKLDIQKASMLKRISAGILDFILLVVLTVGFMALIAVISDFDGHVKNYEGYLDHYATVSGVADYATVKDADGNAVDPSTGFDFVSTEEYKNLSEEEQKIYQEKVDAAIKALNEDEVASKEYMLVMSLTLVITSISIFLAYLILEFILPLVFKNGQTLGKKAFGIAVMHQNCVKVTPTAMFIRTFLGKFAIETMIPVLIVLMIFFNVIGYVAWIVLGGILLLELVCMFYKKQRLLIHDILAKTVSVDLASQMIYATEEEAVEAQRLAQYEQSTDYVPGSFSFNKTTSGDEIVKQDNVGTDDIEDTCGTDDEEVIFDEQPQNIVDEHIDNAQDAYIEQQENRVDDTQDL